MEKTSKLYKVLSFISENPGLTMKEIKARLGNDVNPNTISQYLDGYYGYTVGNHHCGGRTCPQYIEVNKSLDLCIRRYVRRFYLTELGKEQLSK